MTHRVVLCILDGLGLNPETTGNAVAAAATPCLDRLLSSSPNATLVTSGEDVGLPAGQMGNSEVGHLNIGAGRTVEQWLLRVERGLRPGALAASGGIGDLLRNTAPASALHLVGLFSTGGVHSHSDHLLTLLRHVTSTRPGPVLLHLISDGRDTGPQDFLKSLEKFIHLLPEFPGVRIATVIGRYFAMDRDNRWDRVKRAYDAIVSGAGLEASDPLASVRFCYTSSVTDEFIEPLVFDRRGVRPGDSVLFWNFRADRMRQLVRALCLPGFDGFSRDDPPFPAGHALCFTEYDRTFGLPFLFAPDEVTEHLGKVVSDAGLTQVRAAESEKYPHVTYFLSGGVEALLPGESRIEVPSPRDVATYDLKPEMSAAELTDGVVDVILSDGADLLVMNYANCDMVGHTGVFEAAVKAVETVDHSLSRVVAAAEKRGWRMVIIADHGNAEQMVDYDTGAPHTAHTTYPVPVIVHNVPTVRSLRAGGSLRDVAPTVLALMGLAAPPAMTGVSLVEGPS